MLDHDRGRRSEDIRDSDSVLVLRVGQPGCEDGRVSRGTFDVEIDLETGELLESDRSPWKRWEVAITEPPAGPSDSAAEDSLPRGFAAERRPLPLRVSPDRLLANLVESPLPEYPEIARLARVRGTTVLEVFVSETGEVEHVVTVRGLPLGIDDANEASLRTWRFRPFELDGASTRVVGHCRALFRVCRD